MLLGIGIPNPVSGITNAVGNGIVGAFSALLRALSADFLTNVAGPVTRYVLHTPDLGAETTLRHFAALSFGVLLAVAGLLVAIAATAAIPGATSRVSVAARDVLGARLLSCLLTAAVSFPLVALEVQLANRCVDAFVAGGFDTGRNPLWTALTAAVHGDAGAGLALLVTTVVGVVLLVVLVVLGLARWATLWLLVVLAPVAMGFALLPGGGWVAQLWWRLQLATVFLPVANAVLLGTYVAMFTSDHSGFVGALSGVAVLALLAKLPVWTLGVAAGLGSADLTARVRRGHGVARRALVRTSSVRERSGR